MYIVGQKIKTILALLLLCCFAVSAEELRGRVVRVADGDTITVLDSANTQHKIRFQGIDAPEKAQAFGKVSRTYLSGMVAGRDVRVTYKERDRYDRILGTVYVDDKDVNLEMIKAGLAWHYSFYDQTAAYAAAEKEARAAKRGLWRDPNPIEPHEFRKAKRSGNGGQR